MESVIGHLKWPSRWNPEVDTGFVSYLAAVPNLCSKPNDLQKNLAFFDETTAEALACIRSSLPMEPEKARW